jgi:hypothetical protein
MFLPFSKWLRLPGRIALLLGMGALSAAAAKADASEMGGGPSRVPQQSAKSFGELRVWSDDGRIFISEAGRAAEELRLGDTAEARRLKRLLEEDGAAAESPRVLPQRIILVGGGGEGIHWTPVDSTGTSGKAASRGTAGFGAAKPAAPAQTTAPANTGAPGKPHAASSEKKG